MRITVLDGHTLNPGDNPWTPLEALGELTVHDRTPPDLIVSRAEDTDLTLTPHIAWAAIEARQRLMAVTAENIAAFQAGKPIHTV